MSQRVCTRLRPSHLTSKSLSYQPHHQQWLLITNPQLHRTRKPNPHGIPPQHRRASSMRESRGNPRRPSQPSVAVAQARQQRVALEAGDLPDDVGLLPGTLVMPTGRNRPGWFGQFKERWMLEKRRWWTRGVGLVELLYFRYFGVRPRPKSLKVLRLTSTLPRIAKDLHIQMMNALASGNLSPVTETLCPGVLASLRRRISERAPSTGLRWRYEQLARPKLVSLRATLIPQSGKGEGQQSGIMQAVVRITSRQSVQRIKKIKSKVKGEEDRIVVIDAAGRIVPEELVETPPLRRSVEYVVIQSVLRKSKMGPWMIWGMADETTMEKIREMQGDVKPKPKQGMQVQA